MVQNGWQKISTVSSILEARHILLRFLIDFGSLINPGQKTEKIKSEIMFRAQKVVIEMLLTTNYYLGLLALRRLLK
jgi:hypothetical protein